MGSRLRAVRRLSLYFAWTVLLIPLQAIALALGSDLRDRLPVLYHRVVCRILGFEIRVIGTPSQARPTLFVSNHLSYLDIEVLGSMLTASFIAKTEVAGWPLFGLLAKLQRTVFVDRRVGSTRRHRDEIASRLTAGDNLILFPEGTSNDGNRTLPFKSSLFAVAALEIEGRPLVLQPVSIACTALDGIPLGRSWRKLYAWYGDMDLAPHLWQVTKLGRLTVLVEFHAPITIADFPSRKDLAQHCWAVVAHGMARANAGRIGELGQAA